MPDLFTFTPEQLARQKRHADARKGWKGHAAAPGSGPAGETCASCAHYTHVRHAGSYRKCGLMRARWTGGVATDIKAGDPACEKWAKPDA